MDRRDFVLACSSLSLAALAPGAAHGITVGKEYAAIAPPLPTLDPKRIEVLEFFWYGCPHCFNLEGDLVAWKANLPRDVYFRRMPAVPLPQWVPLAKAYFAAEALGVAEKLHADIFNAIHLSGMNLNDRNTLLTFVERYGVNRDKFAAALDSKDVQAKVTQSQDLGRKSGLDGVPTLVVDGRYRTSVTQTGNHEKLFATMNELIAMARRSKKA